MNQEMRPTSTFYTNKNCACDPWYFCLLHYSKLNAAEKIVVRENMNIRYKEGV